MSSQSSQIVEFETLRSIAHGSISSNYAAIGDPFSHPARMIVVHNNTDGDMILSNDGVNDKIFRAKTSSGVYDFNSNKDSNSPVFVFKKGTQLYVKQSTAPSAGDVLVEVIHAYVAGH